MLHLAGGVAFGVDVGDFFELERAFEGYHEILPAELYVKNARFRGPFCGFSCWKWMAQ